MNNNHVFLKGFYGDDDTHAIPHWGEDKVIEKKDNVIKLLRRLAAKNNINSFKLSNFHFHLTIDYISYQYFLNEVLGYINVRDSDGTYYIPMELCEFKMGMDVYNKDTTFFKKDTYYYDVLMDYYELGIKIKNQLKSDLTNSIPSERIDQDIDFFNIFNKKINFDISFNFLEFIKLLKYSETTECTIELKEIISTMFTLITDIPNNPFKRSFRAFGIIEEPREYNNKGEKI